MTRQQHRRFGWLVGDVEIIEEGEDDKDEDEKGDKEETDDATS